MIRLIRISLLLSLIMTFSLDMNAGDPLLGDLSFLSAKFKTSSSGDKYKGNSLRIYRDKKGNMRHIGYKIFDESILSVSSDSMILQFLERYLLLLDVIGENESASLRMNDDHVSFVKGSRKNLFSEAAENANVSVVKNFSSEKREILVVISHDNIEPSVILSFPFSYELILGRKRNELEASFQQMLGMMPATLKDTLPMPEIELVDSAVWGSRDFRYYQLPELNDRTYYTKKENDDTTPIFDDEFIEKTSANLFMGGVSAHRQMQILQKLYGFKETGFVSSVGQWINYCRTNGLQLYFATEKEFSDHILANVTAVHPGLMYMHLLLVEIPCDVASNDKSVIKGSIRTFIPTHNLKNLFPEQEN